jgi:hypothetical protein
MEVRIFAKIFYIKIYYYRNHGFGKYHINENTVKEMKNLSSLIILIRILRSVLHINESTMNGGFGLMNQTGLFSFREVGKCSV